MIVTGNPEHGRIIAHLAGTGFDPERDICISRVKPNGSLWGGIVFAGYTKIAIWAHMAGQPGWGNRLFLFLGFDYAFNQLGVKKILASVPSTNERALHIDLRMGFKEIGRIPDAVPDGDIVLLSMVPEDCKWLKLRDRYYPVKEAA
jgi:RimJ/RimL family protein N-acetyltransferase